MSPISTLSMGVALGSVAGTDKKKNRQMTERRRVLKMFSKRFTMQNYAIFSTFSAFSSIFFNNFAR